jgi:predicted glycoside hydrolase/deacetylase ChbG (UPF0249 family)
VNADDFGRTPGINEGVFEAHRNGIVTSTTAMVLYPAAADAARLARECPELGVGLHVQLSGGAPGLPPERIPSLLGPDGRFPAKPEGHRSPRPEEALAEAREQLRRFEQLFGRLPTHFDSHHHCHRLPAVLDAVVTLALETGRPVRNASPEVERRLHERGIPTTTAFDEGFFGETATVERLLSIIAALPEGSTELMCHPARVDDELRGSSGYAEPREAEKAALCDPRVRRAVEAAGVRLASFASL